MNNSEIIESIKNNSLEYFTAGGEFKTIERICGKNYIIEKLSSPDDNNKITEICGGFLFFALIDGYKFSFKIIVEPKKLINKQIKTTKEKRKMNNYTTSHKQACFWLLDGFKVKQVYNNSYSTSKTGDDVKIVEWMRDLDHGVLYSYYRIDK